MQLALKAVDREKLDLVKAILEKEHKWHYTNTELAKKVGTNEYKLKHGFKQLFCMSPYEYLINVRVEKAKYYLEFTDYSVKRISVEVGFLHPGNFIKRFKKVTGLPPLEWRKKIRSRKSEPGNNDS
jgi:AraC family transcriptional activator of pyochelin receptor